MHKIISYFLKAVAAVSKYLSQQRSSDQNLESQRKADP